MSKFLTMDEVEKMLAEKGVPFAEFKKAVLKGEVNPCLIDDDNTLKTIRVKKMDKENNVTDYEVFND